VSAASLIIAQCREIQKESCCEHLGRPEPAKYKWTQKLLSTACLCCPVADLFSTKRIC
jgi:hypothetical protein